MFAFFKCVAEAVVEKGAKGLAEMIPGRQFAVGVAEAAWKRYRERKRDAELRAEVQQMANATFDEAKAAAYLRKGLTENGFVVDVANQGDEGLGRALGGGYDLVILDVMLPGRDGWSVLSELRQAGKQTPVLFLSARDTVHYRVKGLELGADDYLVKPYAFSELLARVRSLLRRGPSRQPDA